MAAKKTSTKVLNTLLELEGVAAVTVVGRDGFVIEHQSNADLDLDAVGAIVSTGFGASEVMAEEMNIGKLFMIMIMACKICCMYWKKTTSEPICMAPRMTIMAQMATTTTWKSCPVE